MELSLLCMFVGAGALGFGVGTFLEERNGSEPFRTFVKLVAENPQGLGMAQIQERAREVLDG